ncbi:regulatory protein, LacI [Pandoraea captiosa]|uniref:Regulatory protein, LacI n=1 Tax=Pandoraea captiosa TaxID=2508302 RepID=A0A5E4ZG56_9BURK|nr:XRE family transcriptional regulator [Pandoraea captiosa]VVE59858.1 regulatory protein, LacI [Pandoraea captiosa]
MTISEPRWLVLLRAEAGRTSIQAVATRIGYSRTGVSLVLAGKYPGKTDRIAKAALQALEEAVDCPYLGQPLAGHECRANAMAKTPTHNPMKLSLWRACQQCIHNPKFGGSNA